MSNINIGIIGTGKFAKEYYFPAFASYDNINLYAIANRTSYKAWQTAKKYGIEKVFTGEYGWKKLVENNNINAIAICTPNNLHAEIAIAAAKNGKHILVEKPIATLYKDAQAMIQAAIDNKVILMVAFPQRFLPAFQEAKRIIDTGDLGRIKNIDFSFGHSGPQNWSPQGEWYFDKKRSGGGVLIDLGSHKIDTVLWLLNNKKITNISLTAAFNKRFNIEDNTTLIIEFEEKEFATLHSSWTLKSKPTNNLTVYCEKGKLEVKDNTLKISTDFNATHEKLQKLPSIGHSAKKNSYGSNNI